MGVFDFLKSKKNNDYEEDLDIRSINEIEEDYLENKHREEKFNYNFEIKEIEKSAEEKVENNVELTNEELDRVIIEQIITVIENHKDFETIQATAKKAAKIIGTKNVEVLKDYIVGRVSKPQRMRGRYEGLGDWPMVVENAVLTIIYSYERAGVDELLRITMANTTTRFKAINLLCKLAAKGIEKDKIVDSIIYIMKPYREEEVLKVLGFLSQIKNSQKIEKLLDLYYQKYIIENKLDNAYETMLNLINFKGQCTREQLIFLKALALHEGEIDSSIILNNSDKTLNLSEIPEWLRINATVSFYELNKNDESINRKLKYLKENSLDAELRKYLTNIIE